MTATPRPSFPQPVRSRGQRTRAWLASATVLALAPKCVLCVVAYTGGGAALGSVGRELCGGVDATPGWITALAWLGGVGLMAVLGLMATSGGRRGGGT